MNFHPTPLRRLPFLAGAALALAFSAGAQQGGEPIIFSSPDGGSVSSNLTSLSKLADLPDTLSFAPSGFGADLPSGEAPPPVIPSAVAISEGRQLQNLLNPKKDWTLMTPGEIMGVTSPEKNFQLPERDAMGLRKNPSALERFTERQSGSQFAATNGYSPDNPASASRFSGNRDFQPNADTLNPVSGNLGSAPQTLSQLSTTRRNVAIISPARTQVRIRGNRLTVHLRCRRRLPRNRRKWISSNNCWEQIRQLKVKHPQRVPAAGLLSRRHRQQITVSASQW